MVELQEDLVPVSDKERKGRLLVIQFLGTQQNPFGCGPKKRKQVKNTPLAYSSLNQLQ